MPTWEDGILSLKILETRYTNSQIDEEFLINNKRYWENGSRDSNGGI